MLAEHGGIPAVLWVFGLVAVVAALIAIVFTREKPLVPPPGPVASKEDFAFASIKGLFLRKPFVLVIILPIHRLHGLGGIAVAGCCARVGRFVYALQVAGRQVNGQRTQIFFEV